MCKYVNTLIMSFRGDDTPYLHSRPEVVYSSSVTKFDNKIDMGLIISTSIRIIKKLLCNCMSTNTLFA
jgi:hypothetical protein